MFDHLVRLRQRYQRQKQKRLCSHELQRLARSPLPWAGSMAGVVNEVLENRLSSEEKAWIGRIERLRDGLISHKDRTVDVTDYGAGEPGEHLTPEEMARGRVARKRVSEICERGGLSYRWRLLLFKLVRAYEPASCVELGTSLGMSAAFQAAALELNGRGRLGTLEGSAALAAIALENFEKLGLQQRIQVHVGRFQDTLGGVLRNYQRIDYAFIDGHHDEEATFAYFHQFLPHLADPAVLVFDDILWYEGMQRAWQRIIAHERVRLAVDLGVVGMCVVAGDTQVKESYRIHL